MLDKKVLQQNIIVMLGIEALSDEKKFALLDKMTELVQKRLTVKILRQLPEQNRTAFFEAVDKNDKGAMEETIAGNVPNIAEMIEEEIVALKQEMKGVVDNLNI